MFKCDDFAFNKIKYLKELPQRYVFVDSQNLDTRISNCKVS